MSRAPTFSCLSPYLGPTLEGLGRTLGAVPGACLAHRRALTDSQAGLSTLTLLRKFHKLLVQPVTQENELTRMSHETHGATHTLHTRTVADHLFSQKFLENFRRTFDSYVLYNISWR